MVDFSWVNEILESIDLQGIVPELILLLFGLLAPLVALSDNDRRGMRNFTLFGLGGALLMALGSLFSWHFPIPLVNREFTMESIGVNLYDVFAVTYSSQLLKVIFLAVAFVAVLGVGRPLKGRAEEDWGEFCSLLMFATLGMMIVASATDLIVLVLGIEMASMCSYLLAGFRRDRAGAEASLKYFTIGAVSSGLLLFGVSLLYGMAGTTHIPSLAAAITSGSALTGAGLFAAILVLAGLGFKVSAVPFHAWAPDVYAGAPVPVAGMLAAGSKAMGFAAVFNVFVVGLVGIAHDWQFAVALVAVASMFFGNLVALQQTSLRRMLAYSAIAQAGYLLIAPIVAGALGGSDAAGAATSVYSLGGGYFHLMTNAAMKLGAFLVVAAVLAAGVPDQVDAWRGLGKRLPILAFCMTLFLLSMAGLPPLGGFQSKLVLFSGAVDAGTTHAMGWLTFVAILAVVNSAISLYYYLRVMRAMWVEEGEPGRLEASGSVTAAVLVCAAAVVAMGLWPQPFLDASFQAAKSLLGLA